MFKIRIHLFILFSFLGHPAFAQTATSDRMLKGALFTEYNSTSTTFSLNWERTFATTSNWLYNYRGGIGFRGDGVGIPLGFGAVGGSTAHHPELCILVVPFVQHVRYLFKEGNRSDKQLYIIPAAGYRYTPLKNRFFAKALAGPALFLDPRSDDFWKMDGTIKLSISIAAGYKF